MQPLLLNEAYYGKNKELLLVEKHLEALKRESHTEKNINKSPHLKQIQNILTELFNVNIEIVITPSEFNSMRSLIYSTHQGALKEVAPLKEFFDGKTMYEIEETKKGVRFKKRGLRFPIMYLGYSDIKNTPVDEIMVTILHEIGHLFFYYQKVSTMCVQMLLISDIYRSIKKVIDGYHKIKKLYDSLKDKVSVKVINNMIKLSRYYLRIVERTAYIIVGIFSQKGATKLEKAIKGRDSKYRGKSIDDLKDMIANKFPKSIMSARLFYMLQNVIKNPETLLATNFADALGTIGLKRYDAEKYADSFPAMYGYSASFAKSFSKMDISALNNDSTLMAILLTRTHKQILWLLYFFDPHPDDYQRIKLVKKKLLMEVTTNKNLTNEQKKEIREQIEKVDSVLGSDDVKAIRDVHEFLNFGKFRDKVLSTTSDEDLYR